MRGLGSPRDLGADALLGEDLQQQGVGQAAVDEVDLATPASRASTALLDLGDHAAGDGAVGDESLGLVGVIDWIRESGSEGSRSRPGTSEMIDQLGGLQGAGEGGGGEVGVDVERLAGADLAAERGDDRDDLAVDGVEDVLDVAVRRPCRRGRCRPLAPSSPVP